MKPLICNLKMNHNFQDMLRYKRLLEEVEYDNLVICPSSCFLPVMHSKKYTLASQNISVFSSGNHTGEVSASSLKSIGVNATLIGHSEVKDSFDVKVAKVRQALQNKMHAYVILSDTKEDYDYQYTSFKLLGQIRGILLQVSRKDYENITFIYEPSWLVGGTISLPIKEVENILNYVKQILAEEYNFTFPIYYGGGINVSNIFLFYSSSIIDGLLLGSFCNNPSNIVKFLSSL